MSSWEIWTYSCGLGFFTFIFAISTKFHLGIIMTAVCYRNTLACCCLVLQLRHWLWIVLKMVVKQEVPHLLMNRFKSMLVLLGVGWGTLVTGLVKNRENEEKTCWKTGKLIKMREDSIKICWKVILLEIFQEKRVLCLFNENQLTRNIDPISQLKLAPGKCQ